MWDMKPLQCLVCTGSISRLTRGLQRGHRHDPRHLLRELGQCAPCRPGLGQPPFLSVRSHRAEKPAAHGVMEAEEGRGRSWELKELVDGSPEAPST